MTWLLQPCGVLAGALVLLAGCKEEAAPPPPIRPVLSVVVSPQAERVFGFTGTIQPRFSVDLGFRVLGRIITRNVEVGDEVKVDTVLATIDPLALQLAVRSAIADVAKAQAQVVNATGTEARQQYLQERGASPQSQLEIAQQSQQSATASLQQAEASLSKAREQLTYAQLHSDMDGIVTGVSAQVGQVVAAGQLVLTVARPDEREANVDMPDDLVAGLSQRTPFDIALQLDPSIHATGHVREIAPQADASTRTRRIKIALPDLNEVFRLGTTITATLHTRAAPTIGLPDTALLERDGQDLVWIVDPATRTVATRAVVVSRRDASSVQVASGLEQGMRVVTAGVHSLAPGQRVKMPDEASP